MNYYSIPLVVRNMIFEKIILSLDIYNFFDILLKLRCINKEFRFLIDRELKKFFTLKKISPFGILQNREDFKSIFLRDRLMNTMDKENYMFTEFERDCKSRILCGICNTFLHSECYLSCKVNRLDDYGDHLYDFFTSEIVCWGCYKRIYGNSLEEYIKYEDNIFVCNKVNDFYNYIIS